MKKGLTILGQLTLGVVFIVSSVLKLFPLEPVELYVYSLGFTSWDLTAYLVRLLIGFEFFLGILVISSLWREKVLKLSIGVVSALTLFLLYNALFSNTDNCFCFGDVLPMTPAQSIVKNGVMLALAFALLRSSFSIVLPKQKLIVSIVLIGILSTPFIVNMPDSWIENRYADVADQQVKFPVEKLPDNLPVNLSQGKHIVCFFSIHCKYCQMAGRKLTVMDDRRDDDLPIYYFFYGEEDEIEDYWSKSESYKYPSRFLESGTFFTLSGNSLPSVYLIDDGIVKHKMGYHHIMESTITDFMNE